MGLDQKLAGRGVRGRVLARAAAPALAFDTGPHASITEDSLRRAGFNRAAADAVQVENWLTDYYTSTPTIGSGPKCDLDKLHFDDVFSNADIAAYWTTLAANTKAAAQQAERDNDVVEFYTVLGMSLHVVQDYYTHSNWVEQNDASGSYKTTTWFETTAPPAGLFTGWYPNCLNVPQGDLVDAAIVGERNELLVDWQAREQGCLCEVRDLLRVRRFRSLGAISQEPAAVSFLVHRRTDSSPSGVKAERHSPREDRPRDRPKFTWTRAI